MPERLTDPGESKPGERCTRRPYTTPLLHVYGTVAAMTNSQTKAASHKADGGVSPGNTKT
jgi:hypothetical protein